MSSKFLVRVIVVLFGFLVLLGGGLSFGAQDQRQEVPNVIILVLSGVRNSESILDPRHQYMPHLWNTMKQEGVLYSNLMANDHEFHMSAVSSVVNGINQMGYYDIQAPTLFQYVRKKYAWPEDKTWIIGRWMSGDGQGYRTMGKYGAGTYPAELPVNMKVADNVKKLLSRRSVNFIEKFYRELGITPDIFALCMWDGIAEQTFVFFQKIIRVAKPKLVEFVLNGTETGHYDTFARYALSLKRADAMIFEIWQMIQDDPYYKGHTYLIVCPDHERDIYYMDHGQRAYNNRSSTWMYIYGPDIKKGVTINRRVYHVDAFATVARIMDVETHPTSGKVLEDSFLRVNQ